MIWIKFITKYGAILYVAQALAGAVVGIYMGVTYPHEIMERWNETNN